jgi:DNA repair exonuclease SbcCD ATPase subunit
LTCSWPAIFFTELRKIITDLLSDMKKVLILSMFTSFTIICSCQKQDSAAEQQLAQRKAELDTREEALDERVNGLQERVNALDERVNALSEKERATMNVRPHLTDVQGQVSDPTQVQAERDRAIQQLSAMIPSRSQIEEAEKEREIQRAQKLPGLGELQSQKQLGADELETLRQRKLEAAGLSPAPQ